MPPHVHDPTLPATGHFLMYPVPGIDGSIEPGHRRIMWAWYVVPGIADPLATFEEVMTDVRVPPLLVALLLVKSTRPCSSCVRARADYCCELPPLPLTHSAPAVSCAGEWRAQQGGCQAWAGSASDRLAAARDRQRSAAAAARCHRQPHGRPVSAGATRHRRATDVPTPSHHARSLHSLWPVDPI